MVDRVFLVDWVVGFCVLWAGRDFWFIIIIGSGCKFGLGVVEFNKDQCCIIHKLRDQICNYSKLLSKGIF